VPASSYRGLGGAQVTFPSESQIDELAEMSGCDAVEFRLKNLAESRELIHPGMRPIDADVPGDVREAARSLRMTRPLQPGHGRSVVLLRERCWGASCDAGDGASVCRTAPCPC